MSLDPESSERAHALVIGIDDYPHIDAAPLHGCRHDAELVAALLEERFGFAPGRVRGLFDRDATRDGILEALGDLRRAVGPDDRVLVHYSGHGSRIVRGSVTRETLVPHDSGRGSAPNRDILDVEIRDWLLELTRVTSAVTLIFDSCHAGSITRRPDGERWVEADRRPAAWLGRGVLPAWRSVSGPRGPSGWLPLSERYTLFAACRAEESARELQDPETGRHHGAFTFHLARVLIEESGRGATHRELFERVAPRVRLAAPGQHPQLEGAWDRELFGRGWSVPAVHLPILERQGSQVRLGGGTVHGLTVGSEWEVYPPGTREVRGASSCGRVRVIRRATADASAAVLTETSSGAVAAGTRAFEVSRPACCFRLDVRLPEDPSAMELATRLDGAPLISVLRGGSPGDRPLTVHRLSPRTRAESEQVPAVWVVVDAADRLCMPPIPTARPAAVEELARNLETLARHRALLELHNPFGSRDPLRSRLDVRLHRWAGGRRVEGPDRPLELVEGDGLGVTVRHDHPEPLHLAILDLGLTGSVSLLHPVRGAVEPLVPGRALTLGDTPESAPRVWIPDQLPYPGETFEQGWETLLVVASTREADLGLLTQPGVRRQPLGACSPTLRHLLRPPLRDGAVNPAAEPLEMTNPEPWTTVHRSFLVRRR